MNEPKLLDCFSGIGGFSLAFESEGFRTVGFVECDEIKRIVLRHWWPGVPILPDVRDTAAIAEFCREHGPIDVLTGGVPCQPASALGQQRGTADERWLWPETIRLVGAVRPRYAIFENPPALLTLESGRAWNGIVSELVALGYHLQWDVFPAAAFGAGHLRERVILVCSDARYADQTNAIITGRDARHGATGNGHCSTSPHPDNPRLQRHAGNEDRCGGGQNEKRPTTTADLRGRVFATEEGQPPWWHEANTGIPVLANGIPSKLAEAAARCTGDSIVPQVAQIFARAIKQTLT